ncbi:MAG: HAD family hydrolase [Syntrophobacteraceae bacterium]
MRLESFIFDFDGTLAELRLDFSEMKLRLSSLAAKFFAPAPPPPFLPVLEWVAWLDESIMESNGRRAAGFRQEALALISQMELDAARNGSLFPFTRPLLKEIAGKGMKIAIITRNCDAAVRLVFPDISECCSAFLARDHVPFPKPDPSHLLRALEAIGADLNTSVMVGDHPLDIQTGKAAGVRTAGVCSGRISKEELLAAGADWVSQDCETLARLLTEQGMIV